MIPPSPSLFQAVRRYWYALVLLTGLGVLIAFALSLLMPPQARSTALLGLQDPRGNSVFRTANLSPTDLTAYAQGRADFAASQPVLTDAAELLADQPPVETLADAVRVVASPKSPTLEITATGENAAQSTARANAVARAYRDLSAKGTQAQAKQALEALEASRRQVIASAKGDPKGATTAGRAAPAALAALSQRESEIQLGASLFGDGVSYQVDANGASTERTASRGRNLLAGLLIGLLAGAAATIVLAGRRRPVEDEDAMAEAFGAPLLGTVRPQRREAGDEQFELILGGMQLSENGTMLALTSPVRSQDLVIVAERLAFAAAATGLRVGLVGGPGVVLEGGDPAGEEPLIRRVGLGTVEFLTVAAVTASPGKIAELRHRCHLVFIACPSLEEVGAAALVNSADLSVLVARRGTPSTLLLRSRHLLVRLHPPVLGCIFLSGRIDRLESPVYSAALNLSILPTVPSGAGQGLATRNGSPYGTTAQNAPALRRSRDRGHAEPQGSPGWTIDLVEAERNDRLAGPHG